MVNIHCYFALPLIGKKKKELGGKLHKDGVLTFKGLIGPLRGAGIQDVKIYRLQLPKIREGKVGENVHEFRASVQL
jgi:hypothetical protein